MPNPAIFTSIVASPPQVRLQPQVHLASVSSDPESETENVLDRLVGGEGIMGTSTRIYTATV